MTVIWTVSYPNGRTTFRTGAGLIFHRPKWLPSPLCPPPCVRRLGQAPFRKRVPFARRRAETTARRASKIDIAAQLVLPGFWYNVSFGHCGQATAGDLIAFGSFFDRFSIAFCSYFDRIFPATLKIEHDVKNRA